MAFHVAGWWHAPCDAISPALSRALSFRDSTCPFVSAGYLRGIPPLVPPLLQAPVAPASSRLLTHRKDKKAAHADQREHRRPDTDPLCLVRSKPASPSSRNQVSSVACLLCTPPPVPPLARNRQASISFDLQACLKCIRILHYRPSVRQLRGACFMLGQGLHPGLQDPNAWLSGFYLLLHGEMLLLDALQSLCQRVTSPALLVELTSTQQE